MNIRQASELAVHLTRLGRTPVYGELRDAGKGRQQETFVGTLESFERFGPRKLHLRVVLRTVHFFTTMRRECDAPAATFEVDLRDLVGPEITPGSVTLRRKSAESDGGIRSDFKFGAAAQESNPKAQAA